jgi:hypothetical protein
MAANAATMTAFASVHRILDAVAQLIIAPSVYARTGTNAFAWPRRIASYRRMRVGRTSVKTTAPRLLTAPSYSAGLCIAPTV